MPRKAMAHKKQVKCLTNKETFSYHVAKPSPALCDRSAIVATGRALGGGSSVNCTRFNFVVDAQN